MVLSTLSEPDGQKLITSCKQITKKAKKKSNFFARSQSYYRKDLTGMAILGRTDMNWRLTKRKGYYR